MLGVKAKPAKAGRFASLDPCARIKPRTTMIVAAEPGLAAGHVSTGHGQWRGPFSTQNRGPVSVKIDTPAAARKSSRKLDVVETVRRQGEDAEHALDPS